MSDELNRMVQVFRVHELQILLGFANKNRFGKKNELLDRVRDLISRNPPSSFQNKIRELYQKRFPQQDCSGQRSGSYYSTRSTAEQIQDSMMRNSQMNGVQRPPGYPSGLVNPMHSQYNQNYGSMAQQRGGYTGGTVKPIKLPFYDAMTTLLHPQLLVPRHGEKLHDTYFSFNVEQQHDRHIALNYDKSKTPLPRVEMQLRFFPADTTGEQKDDFPLDCIVRVNDLQVDLPAIIPTNKQGAEAKRLSRPVDITSYYCTRRHKALRMNITWRQSQQDKEKLWMCGVYLVRRVTSTILLQRLKQIGPSMPMETKTLIRRKLSMDTDSDICTENLRVSLMCPLVKIRMNIPGKVRNCSHVQCFDLDSFLKMNEKRPTWVCPVCNKPAPYDQLIIEGYFSSVLEEVREQEAVDGKKIVEIEVFKAGNWTPISEEQKDKEEAAKTAARDKACAVIPDTISPLPSKGGAEKGSIPPPPTKPAADVIDLCDSSDEEDEGTDSRAAVSNGGPESVERASSVSSSLGAPYTPVNYANTTPGPRTVDNNRGFSSSSSSSSDSRASPSIIVLDSPPSNPGASTSGNCEDQTSGKRAYPSPAPASSSQPPKKRYYQQPSEVEEYGGKSSVICAPGTSAPPPPSLPSLTDQTGYPTAPRIMSGGSSSQSQQYHPSSSPLPPVSMAGMGYGGMPPFTAPYYQQLQGSFPFAPGLLPYAPGPNGNNGMTNYDEAFLGALEQNANVNYMQFLNECMADSSRLQMHK